MGTENGQKIHQAIRAVCNMHADVSKLLVEFDRLAPWPSDSVFQNSATRDLTYNVRADFWMPEGVYRYLSCKAEPRLIEAAMVCFVSPGLEEPALILAQIRYQDGEGDLRSVCEEWDLWQLFFDWNREWEIGKPMNCTVLAPHNTRIQWVRAVYVPLYSITSMDEVRGHLERLHSYSASA